jgi:uncharacterized membrane protein
MAEDNSSARESMLARLLAFSDGVFAIVLTLLALDLRLPPGASDAHLLQALVGMKGEFISFTISFALVGVFWLAHVTMLRALATFDWTVAVVNLLFLFTVTLTPFTSLLVGQDGMLGDAWRLYCLNIIAIAATQVLLLALSHRDEPRLIHEAHRGRLGVRALRASSPGIAFAAGLALSYAGFHWLASFCWVLTLPILLAARLMERSTRPPKP